MRIVVIGGGITGQLVQHAIPSAEVFDWGKSGRLMRSFGTNYLHEPLPGIRCRQFVVYTHIDGVPPTWPAVVRYKQKIGKLYEIDPTRLGKTEDLMRRQFPDVSIGYDLDEPLSSSIKYEMRAISINTGQRRVVWADGSVTTYDFLISTIPMYALLTLTGAHPSVLSGFRYDPIYVKIMQRPPDAPYPKDAMYVNYLSNPDLPAYRFCDRGEDRHYEGLTAMGVMPTMKIVPGKIHPIPEQARHEILDQMGRCQIRCFGRFASWNPEELVHETYLRILQFKEKEQL